MPNTSSLIFDCACNDYDPAGKAELLAQPVGQIHLILILGHNRSKSLAIPIPCANSSLMWSKQTRHRAPQFSAAFQLIGTATHTRRPSGDHGRLTDVISHRRLLPYMKTSGLLLKFFNVTAKSEFTGLASILRVTTIKVEMEVAV